MNKEKLFVWMQYLLPQHLISRVTGRLAETRIGWIKNNLISAFIKRFEVDMSEAAQPDPRAYEHFNAFFTRELKAGARPLAADPTQLLSPADGAVSEMGPITEGRILQAKGQTYSLQRLLGGDLNKAQPFVGGSFATIYLSPKDYHRVHMPLQGKLLETLYVPGQLFSVNQTTADQVPNLFARNERLVCFFETPAGPMAMILVGAMIVAGIETVWDGQVAPPARRVTVKNFADPAPILLERGAEMGRFKLGSTVILLFGPDAMAWRDDLAAGSAVRMGEGLGEIQALSTASPANEAAAPQTEPESASQTTAEQQEEQQEEDQQDEQEAASAESSKIKS
ncbi:archaetidylserine decarboxylase [Marinospirillum sp.]|uniref:archaetidylserine decarboxylase n=1 Tax=Marinospirillum sp. TaxID=2183934 RepID=UPI003A846E88